MDICRTVKVLQKSGCRYASSRGRGGINNRGVTSFRSDLARFLGPQNFKGLHKKNPLAYSNEKEEGTNYLTAYRARASDRLKRNGTNWRNVFANGRDDYQRPFPDNEHCKTASVVPQDVKNAIAEGAAAGHTSQSLSFEYGIPIPRIEAIIKLHAIEQTYETTQDLEKFDKTLTNMFPKFYASARLREQLTEIPIPEKTRHQRFLTIAESEPFGPVDAANVLDIEPAAVTLEKLNTHGNVSSKKTVQAAGFIAPVLEGEKAQFKFTNAKVGNVGFRYGAARDDRKAGRAVRYTSAGHMVYA